MKLNEATNLDFQNRFSKATSDEINPLFKEFFEQAGFPGYDKNKFDEFVDKNYSNLYSECKKYTLSMDNPFMKFLMEYAKKNGNIDAFINYDNYAFIHNLIANNVINEKQLAFTCPENDQIRILLNPNLYDINDSDRRYLVDIYQYIVSNDLNKYIKNAYIRAIFGDDNINNNRPELLTLLYFTNYLTELNDAGVKRSDLSDDELKRLGEQAKSKANPNALVSGKFIPVDNIEHQFKLLSELVQQSARDAATGKYQKTDTENASRNETGIKSNRFSPEQRRVIASRMRDIRKSLETIYNNGNQISDGDFKALISALNDELNR